MTTVGLADYVASTFSQIGSNYTHTGAVEQISSVKLKTYKETKLKQNLIKQKRKKKEMFPNDILEQCRGQ